MCAVGVFPAFYKPKLWGTCRELCRKVGLMNLGYSEFITVNNVAYMKPAVIRDKHHCA